MTYEVKVNSLDGMAKLIGAVLGTAIEPDKTKRLANGRMNRPEDRGGHDIDWLNSEDGQFWLGLAEQVGTEVHKLPKHQGRSVDIVANIKQIAQDPTRYGYEGIGEGNWDAVLRPDLHTEDEENFGYSDEDDISEFGYSEVDIEDWNVAV